MRIFPRALVARAVSSLREGCIVGDRYGEFYTGSVPVNLRRLVSADSRTWALCRTGTPSDNVLLRKPTGVCLLGLHGRQEKEGLRELGWPYGVPERLHKPHCRCRCRQVQVQLGAGARCKAQGARCSLGAIITRCRCIVQPPSPRRRTQIRAGFKGAYPSTYAGVLTPDGTWRAERVLGTPQFQLDSTRELGRWAEFLFRQSIRQSMRFNYTLHHAP